MLKMKKNKELLKKKKKERPQKGVPSDPHPQDRHSGTGIGGVEKKFRKGGGGPGNYGTVKDALIGRDLDKEETDNKDEETTEETKKVTTLEEYYQ